MQLQEHVYEGLVAEDAVDASVSARMRRRPLGRNLRDRLSQIVSMYVPSTSSEHRVDIETGDHAGLLAMQESKVEYAAHKPNELYDIRLLYGGESLIKQMTDAVGVSSTLLSGQTRRIVSIAADDHTVYASVEEVPAVFLLKSYQEIPLKADPELMPMKGFLKLNVPGIGDLVPQDMCVYTPGAEGIVLYVVGWVQSSNAAGKDDDRKRWLLAKFSVSGQHISHTRIYQYQRYSGLSIDSKDGKLLLACPMLGEIPANKNSSEKPEISAGQLCKLTSGFERRVFSVTMGNDVANYRPDFVAQESAGHCCWASVQKTTNLVGKENGRTGDQQSKVARRLFAFPGRQLNGDEKKSPREWLHVVSWDFADLNPGRIAAFDADRLLVIDSSAGTLSYVTWVGGVEKPALHRVTRPSSKPIYLICSTYRAPNGEAPSPRPVAYFVAGSNVFSFDFREDRIPA